MPSLKGRMKSSRSNRNCTSR